MITLPAGVASMPNASQRHTINATIYGANNGQNWNVASNATLNVGGNVQSMQVMWLGGGTVNLAECTPSVYQRANTMGDQILTFDYQTSIPLLVIQAARAFIYAEFPVSLVEC